MSVKCLAHFLFEKYVLLLRNGKLQTVHALIPQSGGDPQIGQPPEEGH